tara:strand:+ start:705 stop:908 length:204 start_codon:yes stop_codon:yes gene_type:complete
MTLNEAGHGLLERQRHLGLKTDDAVITDGQGFRLLRHLTALDCSPVLHTAMRASRAGQIPLFASVSD